MTQKVQVHFVLPEQLPAGTTFNKGQYRFTSIAQLVANVADNMLYRGRYESRLDDGSYEVEPGGPGACDPKDVDWDTLPQKPKPETIGGLRYKIQLVTSDPDMSSRGDTAQMYKDKHTQQEWRGTLAEALVIVRAEFPAKTASGHTPFTRANIIVCSDGTW